MLKNELIIETEHLILRPLELNDLDTAHEYASDIENTKYMVYLPNDTVEETKQFLQRVVTEWENESPSFYEFAIVLDGEHIGAVSVSLDESRKEGELGWIINKRYQGNGYATEAAKAILDFSVNQLNVKKVVAHCDYRNEPSCHVMRKIGLSLERDDGTRRYMGSEEDVQEFMYSLKINS